MRILTNPLTDADEIRYRLDIFGDFIYAPALLEAMGTSLAKFSELREDYQHGRSSCLSLSRNSDSDAAFQSARSILTLTAQSAKATLLCLRGIGESLAIYRPRSDGLRQVLSRIQSLTAGESFDYILSAAQKYESLPAEEMRGEFETEYEAAASLDECSKISECVLTGCEPPPPPPQQEGLFRRLWRPSKQERNITDSVEVRDPFCHVRSAMLGEALTRLSDTFAAIASGIYEEFLPLSREIVFYQCAAAFMFSMKNKGYNLCRPDICDETSYAALCDPLLAVEYPRCEGVVANDFRLADGGGLLITGGNNTGKTVSLRALGCAQLFAQGGLYVLAKEAHIAVRGGIYTLYAAAEKEFEAGNEAGRFEQEVRAVACMLDEMRPASLVLMNEIFQTTAYHEGALGMFDILNFIKDIGGGYVLVTHMTELVEMLADRAEHMETAPGYRIVFTDKKSV
ncbi:MAG: hypothetical protein WCQ72_08285 [Eubacteriales bacterium]